MERSCPLHVGWTMVFQGVRCGPGGCDELWKCGFGGGHVYRTPVMEEV